MSRKNWYENEKWQEAFAIYVREQDALLPDDDALSAVTPSPALEARMERLFARRRRGFFVLFGTAGRRVASIVVALLIATATVTVSVEAWRTSVWEFCTRVFEKYTQVMFADGTTVEDSFAVRVPTYLPEGYEPESETDLGTIYRVNYKNDEGKRIIYVEQLKDTNSLIVDTEGAQYTSVKVNEFDGIAYTNKETTTVVFEDGESIYKFSASLDVTEIIKIAESLKEK